MRDILIILTFTCLSCNVVSSNSNSITTDILQSDDNRKLSDSTDFFKICDSLEVWQGGIQGTQVSDSTGPFIFAECHTNKEYDLIWVPKGNILEFKTLIGRDSLFKFYDKEERNHFQNLDCYSFVIPKKGHISNNDSSCDCEDLDTYDYVFPSTVKVYKWTNNKWESKLSKTVRTFEELGQLKINTIYGVE
jgi:hypothetical protein